MTYICQLIPGTTFYIDNPEGETVITLVTAKPGQQQQKSSSRLQTGSWTIQPQIIPSKTGNVTVKILAESGEFVVSIGEGSINTISESAAGDRQSLNGL